MGGSSTGVIGMLEVIQSDFSRLETETTTAEAEADEEYTRFTDDSSQDKAVKSMDLENKNKDKTTAEAGLSYEERVRMREEEIQSLQESLKILGGEDIA